MKNQSEVKSTNNELFEEDKNELFSNDEQIEGLAEKTEDGESYYDRIRREKKEETRRGRKLGRKEIILIAVVVVLVIGGLIAVLAFSNEASWNKVSSAGHQYYLGSSSAINSGTSIKQNDEGKIVTKDENNTKNIITTPIYYDEREAFLLTEDMVYYDPRGNERKCASAFTEFYIDDSGKVYAVKDKASRALDMGFLYNGKDRYVFLEPMTLEMNGYTVSLSPLSYVETTMDGDINIFYYDTKEMETIACGDEVIAYPEGKIYTLELFSNAIIVPEGDRMLLFFAPEKLKALL